MNVFIRTMSTILYKELKTSYKYQNKLQLSASSVVKQQTRCQVLLLTTRSTGFGFELQTALDYYLKTCDGVDSYDCSRKMSFGFLWNSTEKIMWKTILRHYCYLGLKKNFKNQCWLFQQDSSHGAKTTQEWLAIHVPHFILKEEWHSIIGKPESSWLQHLGILQNKVSVKLHHGLESLKVKLLKEWNKIYQSVIHASCKSFTKLLMQKYCILDSVSNIFYGYLVLVSAL